MNIHKIYRPFLKFFRRRRMKKFQKEFGISPTTKILDVGGGFFNWSLISDLPRPIVVNIKIPRGKDATMTWIIADGKALPFADKSFDIVYSNSVIEHLGTLENQMLFAKECRRVGNRYYVQTPYRWFPIEPHFLTPFIHFFPKKIQRKLIRYTVWGLITKPSDQETENILQEIRLLGKKDLHRLFPDADIWHEKFMGLTKSLIAIRK